MSGIVTNSSGWRAVDSDSVEVARYLELATQLLDVMKRKSIEMLKLRPGNSVLDVGCGLGHDAEAILAIVGPAGRVVGIDAGQELIEKAIERTRAKFPRPDYRIGDALALEFADNSFDASRIDRVLQHLNDPARAIAEMVRVTRSGGRVTALEPDWHTMAIAGGDIAVAQAVTRRLASVSISQGDVGRRLVRLLLDAGCDDVDVDAEVLLLRDLGTANFVLHIGKTLAAAISDGAITPDRGEAWWKAVQELDARGQFFASVNGVICGGIIR
jgi:ubiquinone/menaquinone biosynthesis C-methylase UbiE